MTADEIAIDNAIAKLLNYAGSEKIITLLEFEDFIPVHVFTPEDLSTIMDKLEVRGIKLVDDAEFSGDDNFEAEYNADYEPFGQFKNAENDSDEDGYLALMEKKAEIRATVKIAKNATTDDPIKLYLRDIGKENLLTAEEEVILAKQIEHGQEKLWNNFDKVL